MTVLRSYVGGAWTEPADDGRPVLDAVTGDEVARVSSAGIDLAAALDLRPVIRRPGAARADLPPAAALLSRSGQLLREQPPGASTRCLPAPARHLGDSKFDIDGGIGVLLSYASRASANCPTTPFSPKAPSRRWARAGRFVGQHNPHPRCTGSRSRSNAFNFPVWGR